MKQKIKLWAWRTLLSLTCLITASTAWAEPYSVAGTPATIFGAERDASNTATDMTPGANGIYTWTSGEFTLTEGCVVRYKVVQDHSWTNSWGGNYEEGNQHYTIDNAGCYTMTFYFNKTTKDVYAEANKLPDTYTIVGSSTALFGTTWDTGNTANNMTETTSGVYTLTKENVELTAGDITYKAVKNHDYSNGQWPNGSDNNTLNIPQDGLYNVTFTLNINSNELTAVATPQFATTPVFSLASGTYESNQTVTITGTAGTIYYTTDGSEPSTSSSVYSAAISLDDEGTYTIKAIAVKDGNTSTVASATYTIKYNDIYLFGSVGIQHAWNFNNGNYKLITADGVNYTGVYRVNKNTGEDVGYFILGSATGIDWGDEQMIGSNATGENWDINDETIETAMTTVPRSKKPWKVLTGEGLYEFDYNRANNTLVVTKFHGKSIFVYDYARPYIYAEDAERTPLNGEYPGANINIIDETVGGHSGLSTAGNGSGLGKGTLGWYEFPIASTHYPITFKFLHNGDNKVTESELIETSDDIYYYWDGEQYVKLDSRDDAANLRRIVAHVRVQGTKVPTCDGVAMNGPSSFYGQMYYWMAVTKNNEGVRMQITDGTHTYDQTITSDIYLEWTDANSNSYNLINETTLQSRLASKTGVGTIIHLQKNRNTDETHDNNVLGVNTWVWSASENKNVNTTNLGRTWWGRHQSKWAGETSDVNYKNSRFIYQENGLNGQPDVYIETSEDGAEWYTWYEDNSVASVTFGYGTLASDATYPYYDPDKDKKQFNATYESPAVTQQAGELWYVWTPDFTKTGNDNGELIDVTRTYESRAKQKALCSTVREGNFVYYTDIKGWGDDNIFCYIFDGTESLVGPWPGIQMTKIGYDDEGHPVYLIDLSNYNLPSASSTTGIIFNNGKADTDNTKAQTGNLEWENGGCYDYLGLLYRIGGNTDVIDNEPDGYPTTMKLRGVWYSRVKGTLFAKGNNDYNNKSVNGYGYIDFARMETSAGVLQNWDYDQSNWVEIEPSESVSKEDLKGLLYKDFTLYGTKLSSVNPRFKAISISNTANAAEYTPNHFTPAHFNGTPYQKRRGDGEWYFFVEPKPNEFAVIDWAIYKVADDAFYAYANTGFDGTINIDWSYHDKFYSEQNMTTDLTEGEMELCGVNPGTLKDLTGYSGWYAIVKLKETQAVQGVPAYGANEVSPSNSTAKYTVYPILLNDDMATAIETISSDKVARTLKGTRYYNLMGVESSTPFQGVNIIVKEYTDGSRESSKVIMR